MIDRLGMTEAADTGDIVPTASVLARGASRDYKPHFSPTNAANATPANMMMTSGQSIGSRSSLMRFLLGVMAALYFTFFILLTALCFICAPVALMLLFLMFV